MHTFLKYMIVYFNWTVDLYISLDLGKWNMQIIYPMNMDELVRYFILPKRFLDK